MNVCTRRDSLTHLLALAATPLLGRPNATPQDHPTPAPPLYPRHDQLLIVRDPDGTERPVTRPIDWDVRRAHILAHFQSVAGSLPGGERRVPLQIDEIERFERNGLIYRRIRYTAEPGDRVPAWLIVKPDPPITRRPAMLCLHQTTAIGKDEPAGLGGLPNLHYAQELAAQGFVALAPDYPGFGENRTDPYALGYLSATMKGIWNHARGLDVLQSLDDVSPTDLGVIGHSLGGHNAVFVALFDPRLRAIVSSCGFNAFPAYYQGNIAGWSHAGYMPRLKSAYQLDLNRVPFDFPELLAALAPRSIFINAPLHDENFAVEGVRTCTEAARTIFNLIGNDSDLVTLHPDAAHDFPPAQREAAYAFLNQRLVRP